MDKFDEWWNDPATESETDGLDTYAIARLAVEKFTPTNNARQAPETSAQICSDEICSYCRMFGDCYFCNNYSNFKGRKLLPC